MRMNCGATGYGWEKSGRWEKPTLKVLNHGLERRIKIGTPRILPMDWPYSYYTRPDGNIEQNTIGMDLNIDMVLLRIYPFQLGFRGYYRLDDAAAADPFGFEILFYGFSF